MTKISIRFYNDREDNKQLVRFAHELFVILLSQLVPSCFFVAFWLVFLW